MNRMPKLKVQIKENYDKLIKSLVLENEHEGKEVPSIMLRRAEYLEKKVQE